MEFMMLDAAFVLVTVAFFVLSIGYVAGCERLKRGDRWFSTTGSACSYRSDCSCTWRSHCWNRRSS